ncbi:MAG: rod shape-determining protein MreD [Methylophilaceae bacterium]|nr:rod shape-determining protein MreD [Methylophilaceae bacterium]
MKPLSIYVSILLALLLQLLPWSGWGLLLRPDFILLTLIYWMLRAPQHCSIGTAWLVGIVVDLINGGLIGQNALAYTLTAFFAANYQRRLVLFNVGEQAGYVLALLLLAQVILFVVKLFGGGEAPGWTYFLASFTGIIFWQIVSFSRLGNDIHLHPH